jgi:hypothetical protein
VRILKGIQNTQKQIKIKWIPAHVGLEGGTRGFFFFFTKECERMLAMEQTQLEEWNNWYVLKATE